MPSTAFTPYATVSQAQAYAGLNLSNLQDDQVFELLNMSTAMMDSYLGGSLATNTYSETVEAIPATSEWGFGGFGIQLSHAWIQNLSYLEIDYGYHYDPIVMTSGDYYVRPELGWVTTWIGNYTQATQIFGSTFDTQISRAVVTYTAGFDTISVSGSQYPMPAEVMQAYWAIVRAMKPKFDLDISIATGISGDNFNLQPASNRVKQYKLTSETLVFDESDPTFIPQLGEILPTWITRTLDKYKIANLRSGMAPVW